MAAHRLTILGWHPTRLNRLLGHWGTRSKRKRFDRDIIAVEAMRQGIPKATGKRRVGLRITLAPHCRGADPDAYWKSLLDALVMCGLLIDDNRQWVDLGPVTFDRNCIEGTTITLEEI